MLLFGTNLQNIPVVSLQTGRPLAMTTVPVMNPHNLAIKAYQLAGPLLEHPTDSFILVEDIREISHIGMIIDSNDELIKGQDVIELQKIIDYDFKLIGLKVVTKAGQQLGRVNDYSIDSTSFRVFQLIIKRPILKGLFDPELIIHRSSILEVSNTEIIIKDELETVKDQPALTATDFINPFRTEPRPEVSPVD